MRFTSQGFRVFLPVAVLVLILGCGSSSNAPNTTLTVNHAPVATAPTWAPKDNPLVEFATYTFTTTASDPDIGNTVTGYQWDFGDGTAPKVTAVPTVQYAYTSIGTFSVQVRATDNLNLAGTPAAAAVTVVAGPNPFTVTAVTPAAATTLQVQAGSSVQVTFAFQAVYTGLGAVTPAGVMLDANDPTAIVGTAVDGGGGNWTVPVTYPAAAATGTRTVTPKVQVQDSLGARSNTVPFPPLSITTVSGVNSPPVITAAATPTLSAGVNATWQGVPVKFDATATDPDSDAMVYTWAFGDGGTGDILASPDPAALHAIHSFTASGVYKVRFTADDGRAGGQKFVDLNLNILANGPPVLSVVQSPAGNPFAGVPVTFTATATDPNADPVALNWDFGDTGTATGAVVTHTFSAAGNTTVRLTGDDAKGGLTTWSVTLNVQANRPPVTAITTAAATLYEMKPYTFTAAATDPDAGDTVTSYQWDFGDGTALVTSATATQTHTYPSTFTGPASVKVRALDSHNAVGDFSPAVAFQVVATPLPVAAFTSPAATTLNVDLGGTVTQAFTVTATNPRAGTAGVTDPIPAANLTFLPNDAAATVVSAVSNGAGVYTFTVKYTGAAAAGTRTSTPTVSATDSLGIQGLTVAGPLMTLKTLGANHAPAITLTAPATDNTIAWTSKPFTLGFTLNDADNDAVVYTVAWGDGTTTTAPAPAGDFVAGVPVVLTHAYADAFTATSAGVSVVVSATDNRSTNPTALPRTRLVTVKFNALPTAVITTPQASGTPPTGLQAGINPPYVVVPLNGKLGFAGVSTLPGSQDAVVSAWSFSANGSPSSASGDNPGNVIFSGTPSVITPVAVTYTVTDPYGRTATDTKQVLVDGVNTQLFNLAFEYRLKSDNNTNSSLSTVTLAANGLGAAVQIFQDGLTNSYNVQDSPTLAGAKAAISIPVRSDLPFYVEIPGFGNDNTNYLMRIPNAPTGPYQDTDLLAVAPAGSSTFTFSAAAPWNPTLKVVTAQGFAAETASAPQRKLNGFTDLVLGKTPINERWLDRLSVPANDPTTAISWNQSNNAVGMLSGVSAYQSFAEWPTLLLTRATVDLAAAEATATSGKAADLGFVMNYGKYSSDGQVSETFAAFSMQSFRVPAGVTDPYQLSPAWQSPTSEMDSTFLDPTAGLNPTQVDAPVGTFVNNLVYSGPGSAPLAGGIASLPLPYDPNDPDRVPVLAPSTRGYSGIRSVLSYSEYLWSTVWARPLVLNSARPNFLAPLNNPAFFRYSKPKGAWPAASGISPDNSSFDLTARGGGVFNGAAPVGQSGAAAPKTGVGRFFWTAFTPSYQGDANSGAAIARTWLANDGTLQPPTTFTGAPAGDATVAMGFMTPQDTIVDKRARTATGALVTPVALGGYRVTWYNPTKDQNGDPVPPDFWVVELKDANGTKHFMLPCSYPQGTQKITDLILTDARAYLPSGNSAGTGPATVAGKVTDTVAPGYCWFDVPLELRPTPGATLTVFAVKAILKNFPVPQARRLNRPDWVDAVKTATATMLMLTASGSDLTYAYKIPFNFDWDIVVASGPQTPVAP